MQFKRRILKIHHFGSIGLVPMDPGGARVFNFTIYICIVSDMPHTVHLKSYCKSVYLRWGLDVLHYTWGQNTCMYERGN
jgi:hypothetical protein